MASGSILRGIISIRRQVSGRAIQVRKGHEYRGMGWAKRLQAAGGGGEEEVASMWGAQRHMVGKRSVGHHDPGP